MSNLDAKRGFVAMDSEEQRDVASKGGKASRGNSETGDDEE